MVGLYRRTSLGEVSKAVIGIVAMGLLLVPGFFLLIMAGFASANILHHGFSTWVTIGLALMVVVLIDACVLRLAEPNYFPFPTALLVSIMENVVSFGFLAIISL